MSVVFILAGLWVSHRLYVAYVHAVGREERKLRPRWYARLERNAFRGRPNSHLGPKVFLVVNLMLIAAAVAALRRDAPLFAHEGLDSLGAWLELGLIGSVAASCWIVLEGRHLLAFYQQMVRSSKSLRGDGGRLAFGDLLFGAEAGPLSRLVLPTMVALSALPLLLALLGVHLVTPGTPLDRAILWFFLHFAFPQVVLATLVARPLWRLRSQLYD